MPEYVFALLNQDKIRKEAKDTLEYFKKQGVEIKIISGDNPITISQIAKRVGIDNYDKYCNCKELKSIFENNRSNKMSYTYYSNK